MVSTTMFLNSTSTTSEFETFAKFETGIITPTNNPDNLKKPVVFQTCDSKEELLTEMRQFKRDIKDGDHSLYRNI